MAFKSKKQL